jgi:hypothetical protein
MKDEELNKNWNIADKNGNIDIPARLKKLFDKIGFQFRFVTLLGKNELQAIYDTVKFAENFADQQSVEFAEWILEHYEDETLSILEQLTKFKEETK